MRSGRAMLEHTQGSSGIKLIKRYPGIEVIGIEMNSGSLPDHQQQGRHSAQLENRGKTKKQRCSLNSSANEGEHLTQLGGLFGTLFPAFASSSGICCVSRPLSFTLSQLMYQNSDVSQLSQCIQFAWHGSSQQSIDPIVTSLILSPNTIIQMLDALLLLLTFSVLKICSLFSFDREEFNAS